MSINNAEMKEPSSSGEGFEYPDELQPGTKLLGGQYTIVRFLNSGGFGITYVAKDSLDRDVVIKECFPDSICRRSVSIVRARSRAHQAIFASVVERFDQEARSQAKLVHRNIVGVHQVFKDNDTAYMAIDFVNGSDLLDIIESDVQQQPKNVEHWLRQSLDAVGFIHQNGMLHRDISPDNILINEKNDPILIDFGAAREQASKADRVLSTLRVVKDGYSPQEFYVTGSAQSPSSDLYALAATFYHVVSGEAPTDSQSRLSGIAQNQKDIYTPLLGRIPGYPKPLLASIDKALNVLPKNRYQSAREWINVLDSQPTAEKSVVKPIRPIAKTNTKARATRKISKVPVLAGISVAAVIAAGAAAMTFGIGGNAKTAPSTVGISDINFALSTPDQDASVANDLTQVIAPVLISAQAEELPRPISPTPEQEPVGVAAVQPGLISAPAANTPDQIGNAAGSLRTVISSDPTVAGGTSEIESPLISSSEWTVDVPFEAAEISVKEGTFAMITLVRSDIASGPQSWLKSGSIIYAVNGSLVFDSQSIDRAIAQSTNLAEQRFVTVNVRTRASKDAPLEEKALKLQVVRAIELQNGFRFTATQKDTGWETRVARIPKGADTELKIGDIVISEAQTGIVVKDAQDIEQVISKLGQSSAQAAYFTISRNGKMDSASISLGAS